MSSFNSTSPTPTSTSTSTSTSTLTSTSPLLTSSTTPSQRANSKSPTLVSSTHTIPSIASISPSPPATASSSSSTTTTTTTPHPHFSTSTFISCFTQHPKLIKFEQKIQEDPYDIHTWTQLISEFSVLSNPNNKEHIDQLRKFYDEIVQRFPYSTKHWIMYIDFELRVKDHPRVSTLFSKGLRNVHAFELHKVYLNYIKRTHHGDDPPSRTIIKQAYDFVLSKVMHDMASGSIWSDYLTFLKQTQVHSTFEEQQKMEEIRKVYLKAIALPLFNVEQLWRDFDAFENGLNKLTAKKILSEASSSYLIARTCTRTLKQLWDPIDFSSSYHTYPMKPSSPSSLSSSWYTQFNYWKQLISYESSNPLHLEPLQLCARLSWVFWQALHVHDRWPELWFEFGHMVLKLRPHHVGEAIHIFKLGCQMCPGSFLLFFSLADLYESKEELEKAKQVYEDIVLYWETYSDTKKDEVDPTEFVKAKEGFAICWIFYMRYSVRAYGIEALRAVFKRARSHRYCTWPIIVASAHFEFVRTQNTTVPKKLFRYAIATYPSDPAPVLAFADWLIGINDQVNLVSELVKASQSNQLDSLSQFKIMDKLHDYYVQAGNFKFLQQQELEMSLKWPQWTSQLLFAQKKFRFGALTPLERDLGPFTSLGTPSTPSTVPSSHLNTLMMTSGPATSSMLLNNTDQETSGLQKRRILDEWVAPDHIPAPDTLSHRGWSHFKLPKKEEIKPTSTSSTSSSSSSSSSLSSTASASSSSLASSSTSVSATASSASTSNAAYTTMNNTSSANAFDSPKPKELPSSNYPHGHGHGQAHAHAHAHAHHPPPPPPSHFHSHAHSHAHAHESIPHSFRPLSSSTLGSSIPTDSSHLHASKPITSANLSMHHPTDTVMQLLSKLPSAEMFTGPYFDVHGVLNLIENAVHMPSMLTSTLSTHPPSSLPPPPPSLPPPLTSATPTSIQTASTPTPTSSSTPHPNPSVTSSSYFIDPKDPRRRKRVLDEVANVPSHPLVQKKYRLVNEHL